jgi:phosphoribosylamine--glycine ligase
VGHRVLVVGSGGREHAIARRLAEDDGVDELVMAPGNPGMAPLGRVVAIAVDDVDGLVTLAVAERIDLVVVGPEVPLTLGIVDLFQSKGLKCWGPSKAAGVGMRSRIQP